MKIYSKKIVADCLTPVLAYTSIKDSRYSFLLESVEKGKTGRYTMIGFDPGEIYRLYRNRIEVLKNSGNNNFLHHETIETEDPMSYIQKIQDKYKAETPASDIPFSGALVGYVSYEMIATWEKIDFQNKVDPELPAAIFVLADKLLVFDHLHNTVEFMLTDREDSDNAAEKLDDLVNNIEGRGRIIEPLSLDKKKDVDIKSNFTKEEFENAVKNIKEDIMAGEIIQGVFSQRLSAKSETDPFKYYRALRVINPSPYMFYLKLDDIIICGSSPEVMVKAESGIASLVPIAGTRPRSDNAEEEKRLMEELQSDEKELAEHLMLVDLGRNDLARIALAGTVKVSNMMSIEKFSHVMHMVTDLSAKIKDGISNVDVFKACFPAGTVSGAPKIRAIEIVEREENIARGPYAGAVGYFSFNGDMNMGIIIRTMLVCKGRVYVQAGAGIVADSDPEKEYNETLSKAKALLEAVRIAEGNK